MNLHQYLETVNKRLNSGISREHAYRTDLETLIRELVPGVEITNEPSVATDCGNPDYVITKGKIPLGFIEAKDVGKDLNHNQYKAQFDRYRKALDNLIITDYLWFQFFQHGELVHEIHIAEIHDGKLTPLSDNFEAFTNLIQNFCTYVSQTIKSPKRLAEMMAAKARLLENILENAITSDERTEENTTLKQQYKAFQEILIHDLTPKGFSDIYAQTLAYGMFAARLHDPSLDTFSRQEAAELIPKSNPFLRKLFNHVAGVDIDERIKTTVDNLADVFRATNVEELLKNFGKSTQTHDPIIHFYETFLAEYDPKLRKARGVWYTPEPVVKFIVRSVDEILKTEFGLKDGLADTTKTKIKFKTDQPDRRTKSGYVEIDKEVHKVQVLDPATGTGTFLAEVVKFIHDKKFNAMQGAWSGYVDEHLIPRLNGFELLMASYAMAHLKLDMLLSQTGYKSTKNQRLNVFLTNSLEEHHPDTGTLFSSWLSTEANEANTVKRDTPVMVVMGNPPYSVSSSNKGEWIQELLNEYKKDLNEINIQPLSDDYIKFIRYGHHLIDKNNEGIVAFITNNSFIDGRIHRRMRESIFKSFEHIYILDLHGSSKKNESTPDGNTDQNVFDIQQGVSIAFLIKKGQKSNTTNIWQFDLLGDRNHKYKFLKENSIRDIRWEKLTPKFPYYFFTKKDFSSESSYNKGFDISELFNLFACGAVTARDKLLVKMSEKDTLKLMDDFSLLDEEQFRNKHNEHKDSRDWKYAGAKKDIIKGNVFIAEYSYRPFDIRFCPYSKNSKGILSYPRYEIMKHMNSKENIAILICKQQSSFDFQHVFISKVITDKCTISTQTKEASYHFPLYLVHDDNQLEDAQAYSRTPNLNRKVLNKFSESIGCIFTNDKEETSATYAPIDILDYIYCVLYSTNYRSKYKSFLKTDFPRIPYPKDKNTFWALVKHGTELRQIHLLESDVVENFITSYPIDGDNEITRKIASKDWELYDTEKQLGRIWINDEQYFDQIPLIAWEFYIGGYQPAQKWLKDRKGRKLSYEDINHYQKIIVALFETDRIMKEIDKIDFM